jgi:ferredoxin
MESSNNDVASTTAAETNDMSIIKEQQLKSHDETAYPVQIHHQGHTATIHVRENEPILQALERQASSTGKSSINSLGLSSIPHECRRGNCLTCASRLLPEDDFGLNNSNVQANVNNGLAPSISRDLTRNGYILTCCSYITGPGISLEIEQNEQVWERVYKSRFDNIHEIGMEVRARQMRKADERNVGKWKKSMEKLFGNSDN